MEQFLDWKYLNESQVNSLDGELDEAKVKELIRKYIHIPFIDPQQQEFSISFHFFNFSFCKEQAFDARKISTFMSIMNDIFVHDMNTADPGNTMTKSFNEFKDQILRHSVERPPRSIKVFDREEAGNILRYVTDRRFRLYKYIYCPKIIRQFRQVLPQEVEYPVVFPSLATAVISTAIPSQRSADEEEFADE